MADDEKSNSDLPGSYLNPAGMSTSIEPPKQVEAEPRLDGFSCSVVMPLYGRTEGGGLVAAGIDFISDKRAAVLSEFRKSVAKALGDEGIVHRNQFQRTHFTVQDLLVTMGSARKVRITRTLSRREAFEILARQSITEEGIEWRLSMNPDAVGALISGRSCRFDAWSANGSATLDFLLVPDADKVWAKTPIVDEVLVAEEHLGAFVANPLIPGQMGRAYRVPLDWERMQELLDFSTLRLDVDEGRRLTILVARDPSSLVRLGGAAIQHMWVPNEFGDGVGLLDDLTPTSSGIGTATPPSVATAESNASQPFLQLALVIPWHLKVKAAHVEAYGKGSRSFRGSVADDLSPCGENEKSGGATHATEDDGLMHAAAIAGMRGGVRAALDRIVADLGLSESLAGSSQFVAAGPIFSVGGGDLSEGIDLVGNFMSDAIGQFCAVGAGMGNANDPSAAVDGVAVIDVAASVAAEEVMICALIENPVREIDWRCAAIHEDLIRGLLMDKSLEGAFEDIAWLRNEYGVGTDISLHNAFDDVHGAFGLDAPSLRNVPLSDRCHHLLRHLNAHLPHYGFEIFRAEPRGTRIARVNDQLARKFGSHTLGWWTGRVLGRHGRMLVIELNPNRVPGGSALLSLLKGGCLAPVSCSRSFSIGFEVPKPANDEEEPFMDRGTSALRVGSEADEYMDNDAELSLPLATKERVR